MKLIQFKISGHGTETIITALDKKSAWRKFVTQRFGALKPGPGEYDVTPYRGVNGPAP